MHRNGIFHRDVRPFVAASPRELPPGRRAARKALPPLPPSTKPRRSPDLGRASLGWAPRSASELARNARLCTVGQDPSILGGEENQRARAQPEVKPENLLLEDGPAERGKAERGARAARASRARGGSARLPRGRAEQVPRALAARSASCHPAAPSPPLPASPSLGPGR